MTDAACKSADMLGVGLSFAAVLIVLVAYDLIPRLYAMHLLAKYGRGQAGDDAP